MPANYVLLQKNTVGGAGASSVTFSSIPQTYSDLIIKVSAKTTDANIAQSMYMTINGGAQGSVLSQNWMIADGSSTAAGYYSSISLVYPFYINGSTSTANSFGNGVIYIPNYANTTKQKSMSSEGVAENSTTSQGRIEVGAISFASTSAITSLLFGPGAGSFTQYSTFYLYGIKNS
jgi:hypothetical protein